MNELRQCIHEYIEDFFKDEEHAVVDFDTLIYALAYDPDDIDLDFWCYVEDMLGIRIDKWDVFPCATLQELEDAFTRLVKGVSVGYQSVVTEQTQALQDNPGTLAPYFYRAHAFMQLGQYEQALADINIILDTKPRHHDSFKLRNEILSRMGKAVFTPDDAKSWNTWHRLWILLLFSSILSLLHVNIQYNALLTSVSAVTIFFNPVAHFLKYFLVDYKTYKVIKKIEYVNRKQATYSADDVNKIIIHSMGNRKIGTSNETKWPFVKMSFQERNSMLNKIQSLLQVEIPFWLISKCKNIYNLTPYIHQLCKNSNEVYNASLNEATQFVDSSDIDTNQKQLFIADLYLLLGNISEADKLMSTALPKAGNNKVCHQILRRIFRKRKRYMSLFLDYLLYGDLLHPIFITFIFACFSIILGYTVFSQALPLGIAAFAIAGSLTILRSVAFLINTLKKSLLT